MRAWMGLLATLFACGDTPLPKIGGDAGIDGPSDAKACFGSFVSVCFTTFADVPTMPMMLPGDTIDTGLSPVCDQRNDQMEQYCVIAGAGITLTAGGTLRAYGS